MINVPIYRAKKIDSDEWVVGYIFNDIVQGTYLVENNLYVGMYAKQNLSYEMRLDKAHKIDPSTLAIHFPNMIDKNGMKIFASLSEYGVGGDILSNSFMDSYPNRTSIVVLLQGTVRLKVSCLYRPFFDNLGWCSMSEERYGDIEVIGIHKGE